MSETGRLVNYEYFCPLCKYHDREGYQDPCKDCLNHPLNKDSRKPIRYKEDKKKSKKQKDN